MTGKQIPSSLISKFLVAPADSSHSKSATPPKRIHACLRCRKSKVKCDNNGEAPCKRCKLSGLECIFQMKVPSYSSTEVKPVEAELSPVRKEKWENKVDDRLEGFGDTLNNILGFLKDGKFTNLLEPVQVTGRDGHGHMTQPIHHSGPVESSLVKEPSGFSGSYAGHRYDESGLASMMTYSTNLDPSVTFNKPAQGWQEKRKQSFDGHNRSSKKLKLNSEANVKLLVKFGDFQELFAVFSRTSVPYLFGYDISSLDRRLMYVTSDLFVSLVCLIGAVGSPRYAHLVDYLRDLYSQQVSDVVLKNKGSNCFSFDEDSASIGEAEYNRFISLCSDRPEQKAWSLLTKEERKSEVTNLRDFQLYLNIAALCIATLWFEKSQLFLGVAYQLASELKLNRSYAQAKIKSLAPEETEAGEAEKKNVSYLTDTNKLKLWYLLYLADGQHSVLTNRPSMVNGSDFSLKNSRKLLIDGDSTAELDSAALLKREGTGATSKTLNEQLISKATTYNDLNLVSHLELTQAMNAVFSGDAWDILTPDLFGLPWKTNLDLDKWMVHWTCLLTPIHIGNNWAIKSTFIYYYFARMHINNEFFKVLTGIKGTASNPVNSLVKKNQELDSSEIAVLSAQALIQSVTRDRDIIDSLRYAPIHIFVMLYYSALVLLESDATEINRRTDFTEVSTKYYNNLILVKSLINIFAENLPVDRDFGLKLTSSLQRKFELKCQNLKRFSEAHLDTSNVDKIRQLDDLNEDEVNHLLDKEDSKSRAQILAWPGTNHGHP